LFMVCRKVHMGSPMRELGERGIRAVYGELANDASDTLMSL
jgi:hypothetical protein